MSEMKQIGRQQTDPRRMNPRMSNEAEIDLIEIFHELLQKAWAIIICLVLGATLAFGYTKFMITPQYSASSKIYILTNTTTIASIADFQMGTQLAPDFEVLTKSRPVVEEVIDEMNLDYSYGQLVSMMSTENATGTRILKLTITNPDPNLAKDIANTWAEVAAERVSYIMNSNKPKILEEAVTPGGPSSPDIRKNTLMGGMVGAVLAGGIIVLLYMMNDTIQTEEDVRKYLDLHTLAALQKEKRR